MKTQNLLFAFLVFVLFACNNDDHETEPVVDLVGDWDMTSALADEPLFDINGDGVSSRELLDELPCRNIFLSLKSDSTFVLSFNGWAYDSQTGAVICTADSSVSGKWSYDPDFSTLAVEFEYDGQVFDNFETPVSISENQLSCRLNIPFYDFDQDGNQGIISGVITFERQW